MNPPKISAPFNPFNLTPSDVGAGWYLLPEGEPLKAGDEFWWPGMGWIDYRCRPMTFRGAWASDDRFYCPPRDYVHTYPWRRKCPETGGGAGSPAGSSAVLTPESSPDAPESPETASGEPWRELLTAAQEVLAAATPTELHHRRMFAPFSKLRTAIEKAKGGKP